MWKQKPLLISLFMLMTFVIGGCAIQPISPAPGEQAEAAETAAGSMPDALTTIEADAEDIMDFAPASDWERIQKDTADMASAWQTYLAQAEADELAPEIQTSMNDALDRLSVAVKSQETGVTMQASNDVSGVVVELFALYDPEVPADIGRLDVLGRQVILDVAAGDWAKAAETLTKTSEVWNRVKPSTLEHKGDEAAAQYDASLAAQTDWLKAKNVEELSSEAANGLEIVDALEVVYTP